MLFRSSKERADMLKALSFDAVAGLGRKAQEAHLTELEALQDKWARKWIENGKKLTDRDYMELERDKVNMQQKVANMKHNVAQYGMHAKTLMEHPELYHPSTVAGMKQYYEGGDVGKDISEVIRYMPDTSSYLGKAYGSLRTARGDESKGAYDPETNSFETRYSNRRQVEERLRSGLQNNEYYKSLINSGDPYIIKKANDDVENFLNSIVTETTGYRGATASELKKMAGGDDVATSNANYFNDFAKRILGHDKKALDLLMSKSLSNFGVPSDYVINKDGGITLYGQPDSKGNMKTINIPPADPDDPDNMRQAMTAVIDLVPASMQGKQKPDNLQSVIDPEYKVAIKEKAPITTLSYLRDVLDVPDTEVGTKYANTDDGKRLYKTDRAKIKEWLGELLPKSKVEVGFGWGKSDLPLKVDGEPYNLSKIGDRQKLMDKVTTTIKAEPYKLQSAGTTQTTTAAPTPDDDIDINEFKRK